MLKTLLVLYTPLVGWVGLGWLLGHKLPASMPTALGLLLFWIGVPLSTIGFLRHANLAGSIWVAPLAAWIAIFLGAGLAWLWLQQQSRLVSSEQKKAPLDSAELTERAEQLELCPGVLVPTPPDLARATQGSFLLAAMVGNTGYLGFPVSLALIGPDYFAWTLFYDILGTALGAYGLGVVLAARFGQGKQTVWDLVKTLLYNPVLWSFSVGLCIRNVPFPALLDQALYAGAWGSVTASLVLLGMRLSQISSGRSIKLAIASLSIKMLIVPLIMGVGISTLGFTGAPRLAMVLQMSMPPAFATLVIGEAYQLDRDLTVTALALGSLAMLATLPLWLILFPL